MKLNLKRIKKSQGKIQKVKLLKIIQQTNISQKKLQLMTTYTISTQSGKV